MDGHDRTEYRTLRETIAARGTLRPVLLVAGLSAWALTLTALLALVANPVTAAVPLVLLVATFEAIRGLSAGVERIGRYIEVFHEPEGPPTAPPAWERAAMRLGPALPGAGGHPLFVLLFGAATAVNYLAVLLPGPLPVEAWTMAIPHAAFIAWLVVADRAARRQRLHERDRYREMRDSK
ncbi:MAG: hypothetical protein AB7O67_14285 [Vicinamibacterales bacterium]